MSWLLMIVSNILAIIGRSDIGLKLIGSVLSFDL